MNIDDLVVGDPDKDAKVLANMSDEEYDKYRGEWVAIVDAKIVAHGKDPRRVNREGYRIGKGIPLMEYVYEDNAVWLFACCGPAR